MFLREKTGKTVSPRSIGVEDAIKKQKKPPMKTPKKRTTLKEDFGKLLLDIGRLITGSIVLGILLRGEIPDDILLTVGIAFVIVLFICGIILGAKKKNGDNGNQTEKKE